MRAGSLMLAGDIGGTKTKLALFEKSPQALRRLREKTYASSAYDSFDKVVADFLAGGEQEVASACFGVAGPVIDGRCRTTNLPWLLDETAIAAAANIPAVRLLNDLQAMALGLLRLPAESLVELNPAARSDGSGNIAVIAAGTGCGEAMLHWDGKTYHALATEGGHADFAPNSSLEDGLLRFLRSEFGGHVSYERILAGPGIYNVYRYLREEGVAAESPRFQQALAAGDDPGALIGRLALEDGDALCLESLRLFSRIYGAEAGNWALKCLANGGVLVGGGIAPKILPILQEGGFMSAFKDKGRFSDWAGGLSVKVSTEPDSALLGAAHQAAMLAD
jgi:glucokinase